MVRKVSGKELRVRFFIFALALVFWFFVKMNKTYDYAVDIPLRITNNNPDICLKHPTPEDVRVEFSGRGIDFLQLKLFSPYYELDISDVSRGLAFDFSQHPEYVRIPEELDLSVRSILRPHELNLEIDQCMEKNVKVLFTPQVETEPGFTVVAIVPKPDSIRVTGPASYVDTLSKILLEKKIYQKVNQPFEDLLNIQRDRHFYSTYSPEKVTVFFDVQRLAEKEIVDVPVNVTNVPDNYEVVPLPSLVKIYVKGGEKILADADAKDFRVDIDFARDWQPGMTKVRAHISTDLQVLYVESRPPQFELIVQKKKR